MLLSKIQGTQALIHYVEGFIDQLVEDKTHNLVDVGSSPMVGLHHMMLLKNIQSPCSLLHNDPALGATLVEVFKSIRQLQVPGCCKHDNPALGGYICGILSFDY